MKTEICKEQYAASMTAMPASSKEQNRSLKRGLSRQELSLQQCYVMIRKEQVVARAVIYDEHSYIGNLTLEAIEQTEADQFVRDVITIWIEAENGASTCIRTKSIIHSYIGR